MNFFRQFFALLRVNLSGVGARLGPVLTIIIGVTCAVGVLVSMLAMGSGARRQELGNVRADRAVVTTIGARGIQSSIARDQAVTTRDLPGIRRDAQGQPIVQFNFVVPIEGRRRGTGARVFFPLAGVTAQTLTEYLPELHFTAGRMFQRGLNELIVSNSCVRQFTGFDIGERRPLRGVEWLVVGRFDQGSTQQCTVYGDVDTLMSAFRRNTYTQVGVMLQSPGEFATLRNALQADPTLQLEVRPERQVVEDGFKQLNALLNFVSLFVGTIMAVGATLGAVNSLYSIVDARRRELATLRAIGFGPGAIVAAVLCESVLLALPGALLGGALAWLLFNNLSASPFGYSFQLDVSPALIRVGILWALAMGLVGGLLPAWRAARVPVTTALRAT